MTKRKRRTPAEAREAILNAAEAHLIAGGSAKIRLQQVARDVGISHPTLLHHVGSREELIEAVAERAFQSLQTSVVHAIADSSAQQSGLGPILERVHQALHDTGHGRALAWLLLEHAAKPHDALSLTTMIDAAHALRTVNAQRDGRPVPGRQDTAFSVLLTTFTLFAESFAGDIAYESAGIGGQGDEFRRWLSGLLEAQLDR